MLNLDFALFYFYYLTILNCCNFRLFKCLQEKLIVNLILEAKVQMKPSGDIFFNYFQ